MWSIYTTKYYSAVKKNDIIKFADGYKLEIQMDRTPPIIPSELTQIPKDKYCMHSRICGY